MKMLISLDSGKGREKYGWVRHVWNYKQNKWCAVEWKVHDALVDNTLWYSRNPTDSLRRTLRSWYPK